MELSDETSLKKPKRLTSVVWNHFERIRKSDMCYAICVHCNKKLSGSSNSGTTHLRNHLMRCLKRSNYDVSQILSAKRRKEDNAITLTSNGYDDGQRKEDCFRQTPIKYDHEIKREGIVRVGSSKFDQDRSRLDLARMIVLHGYPLAMVDHVGFKVFVKNLQPLFDFSSNIAIELYCMEMYGRGKETVREALHNMRGRINIAIEMWSSEEHAEYLSLTACYIDEDWKLQKKMLNFATLDSSHTGDMLSEIVINCITEWNIDCRLFSVTLDDCSMDNDVVMKVRERLSETRPLLGSYQLLNVWSAAHVLDYIVHGAVDAIRVVAQKIRGSIKYIKSSRMVQEKMNEFSLQVGINNSSCLVLDCPVRWNSTYQMIQSALEYRGAFSLLKEHDPSYTSDLSETEWDWATTICGYVKVICEVSNVLSSYESPTANIYFPEMCHVHIQLIEWCKVPDEFVSAIVLKMKETFERYWSKCSLLLAMAVILDPRFKMKLVEYYYSQIYGRTAPDRIKEVYDGIKELFGSYTMSSLVDQGSTLHGNRVPTTSSACRDRLMGFDKFLHETSQGENASSDLEKYLEEPIFPRSSDFNILNWWKVHTPRYPLLAMMARDVLGIPMSNAVPESDCRGRILDSSRSSLDPDIQQALICTRHWLQKESEEKYWSFAAFHRDGVVADDQLSSSSLEYGNNFAIALFISPTSTFRRIFRNKSTEHFSGLPYIYGLLNCLICMWYGSPFVSDDNILIMSVNSLGAAFQLVYIIVFITYAEHLDKVRMSGLVVVIGVFLFVDAGSLHIPNHALRRITVGFPSSCSLISMFASPLFIINLVVCTRSVEFMPFYLSLSTFLMSTSFLLYGVFNADMFIYVPNGIGTLLGIIQFLLYAHYSRKS